MGKNWFTIVEVWLKSFVNAQLWRHDVV